MRYFNDGQQIIILEETNLYSISCDSKTLIEVSEENYNNFIQTIRIQFINSIKSLLNNRKIKNG